MRYAIVIEKAKKNYAAYVPDLPGCVVTGRTLEETKVLIREAIALHIRGMREDGLPIPEPTSLVEYVAATNGKMRSGRGVASTRSKRISHDFQSV